MTRAFVPKVYTPAALAERWGCKPRVVLNMITRGEIAAFQIGSRSWRVKPEDVEAFEAAGGMPKDTRPINVYVIKAGDMVKIGKAVDVAKRLSGLQTASPQALTLLKTIESEDGSALEIALHKRFAGCRVGGEWFRIEGDLATWVNEGFPL